MHDLQGPTLDLKLSPNDREPHENSAMSCKMARIKLPVVSVASATNVVSRFTC